MHKEIYLEQEAYDRLLDAVLAAMFERLAIDGKDALKLALGEVAGIWPEYCRENSLQQM